MMRRVGLIVLLTGVLQLPARLGRAQTATADAIDAFVRGDYQRAAEILKPVTDRWPGKVDEVATFFMAALYENGLGTPQDVVRACALRSRSDLSQGLFGRLNLETVGALQLTLTPEERAGCQLLSQIGFDHGFEPATFTLEPGYWITLELSGKEHGVSATVAYQGRDKTSSVSVHLSPGVRFLPIKHTVLATRGSTPGQRHFIELFTWAPTEIPAGGWQLDWSLSEVVGNDLVSIHREVIATVLDSLQQSDLVVDVRRLAALRVNAAGEAEWAILTGPHARAEAIETDRERQEVLAQRRTREAADERVDWNQARNADRSPLFMYADADGCSNLFVYGWSADRLEAVTVRAHRGQLGLSTAPSTFDLAAQRNTIEVSVDVFERPQRSWPYCTDVFIIGGGRKNTWRAVGGTVTFQLSPPGIRVRQPHSYRVSIQIDGAELVSPSGVRVRLPRPIHLTAIVGSGVGG